MTKLKFHTLDEAEAATEAARRCYEAIVIDAACKAGGKSTLSKLLGYTQNYIHNAIEKGKFSQIRRIAKKIQEAEL